MPTTTSSSPYQGLLRFALPAERLDHDARTYLSFEEGKFWPHEDIWQPLHSLRHELDSLTEPVSKQLQRRGFAVHQHTSRVLEEGGIDDGKRYRAYIQEQIDLMKELTGADEVILWNSVKRDGSVSSSTLLPRQRYPQGLDSQLDKPPEPPALHAHVDQDSVYARRIVNMAFAGSRNEEERVEPFEAMETDMCGKLKRSMIVNLWRPVGGTVYTKPLAVADFSTLSLNSVSIQESPFGCGLNLHHNDKQRWFFIPEQKCSEILLLKCYDSKGADGGALFGAHCAVSEVKGVQVPENAPVRRSVEMRFVLIWH